MFPLARASCEVPATVWYHCLDRYRLLYRLFIGRVCRIPCFGALLFVPSLGRRRPFPLFCPDFYTLAAPRRQAVVAAVLPLHSRAAFRPLFSCMFHPYCRFMGGSPCGVRKSTCRKALEYSAASTRVLSAEYADRLRTPSLRKRVRGRPPCGRIPAVCAGRKA